ncbi:hypothetical protein Prudu_007485 [Prunus dulcis]|uniref:Uncharacterized protein n=1 Tax=Prunus dulcis TaxID=3755 RepID=A0A4Y1R224_PRUDU|nr:hypothetical protein Prudu_007485 [Prunus dulcis]
MNLRSKNMKRQDHHRKPKKTTKKSKSVAKHQKYKAVEESMLRVMKAKDAKFGTPILRKGS